MSLRIQWGREAWRAHIDDWGRSGMSQREYCARRGLSLSTFTLWRRRLRITSDKPSGRSTLADLVDIVPVPCSVAATPEESVLAVSVCGGRYRVEVGGLVSADALRVVLDVLESR